MHLIILVQFTHLADIVSREVGDVEGGGWGKPKIKICLKLCTAEHGMWVPSSMYSIVLDFVLYGMNRRAVF